MKDQPKTGSLLRGLGTDAPITMGLVRGDGSRTILFPAFQAGAALRSGRTGRRGPRPTHLRVAFPATEPDAIVLPIAQAAQAVRA